MRRSSVDRDAWRDAVEHHLAMWESTIGESETPREALHRLIRHEQEVALDPAVSEGARAIRNAALEEAANAIRSSKNGGTFDIVVEAFAAQVDALKSGDRGMSDGPYSVLESDEPPRRLICWHVIDERGIDVRGVFDDQEAANDLRDLLNEAYQKGRTHSPSVSPVDRGAVLEEAAQAAEREAKDYQSRDRDGTAGLNAAEAIRALKSGENG